MVAVVMGDENGADTAGVHIRLGQGFSEIADADAGVKENPAGGIPQKAGVPLAGTAKAVKKHAVSSLGCLWGYRAWASTLSGMLIFFISAPKARIFFSMSS